LVIADSPMRVPHFVFGKDRFERFARCLAITLKSLPQRAAQAKSIAQPRSRAAMPALGRAFTHAPDRIRQAVEIHVLTTNEHEYTRMLKGICVRCQLTGSRMARITRMIGKCRMTKSGVPSV